MKMTRDIAWAAATDAADKNMRDNGRTSWNEEDWKVGACEFERLWPLGRDWPRTE